MPLNITCIGSINLDKYLFNKGNSKNQNSNTDFDQDPFESTFNEELEFIGGSACNTCYFLQNLKDIYEIPFVNPYLLGLVGKDKAGDIILKNLKERGFCLEYIKRWKGDSGNTKIILDENGERIISRGNSVSKFLMYLVSFKKSKYIINESLIHIKSSHLVHQEIFDIKSTIFSSDISGFMDYAFEFDKFLIERPELAISILFGNESEFSSLYGSIFRESESIDLSVMTYNEKALIIRKIMKRFRSTSVYLKMGKKGAMYISWDTWIYSPTISVNVIDTTGAGDAFNAGIIFGLINNHSTENTLKMGCVLGSLNCTMLGSQSIEIDRKILENGMKSINVIYYEK